MLVRNPCMKEDDLVDLMKFERKQLRSIIAQLKNDKFIKVRLRMETGPEGKSTRQNYYFINYKVLVNVVKYKLDHMRRKIDTAERDSTSRASFKCPTCLKSFTDLEADQLCDFTTGEFRCTFCHTVVEEDQSALPKQDSRLLLAKFNDQIEPLYVLLREVEDIKLAPEVLEPEPTDVSDLKRDSKPRLPGQMGNQAHEGGVVWSGDSTRHHDFGLEHDVTISFGDEAKTVGNAIPKKERPIWMLESTVAPEAKDESRLLPENNAIVTDIPSASRKTDEDIMQVLLAHEKKSSNQFPVIPGAGSDNETDTSESDAETTRPKSMPILDEVVEMVDDDEDEEVVMVTIGQLKVPVHEVTEELVTKMSSAEKEVYIKLSQEMYANMYE